MENTQTKNCLFSSGRWKQHLFQLVAKMFQSSEAVENVGTTQAAADTEKCRPHTNCCGSEKLNNQYHKKTVRS